VTVLIIAHRLRVSHHIWQMILTDK
jgi:hypothetical protein